MSKDCICKEICVYVMGPSIVTRPPRGGGVLQEEFRLNAYENAKLYKENIKYWHNKHILKRNFEIGQQVLIFSSQLKLFPSKLWSRWFGPFTVTQVYPYGVVEVHSEAISAFKVNRQ